MDLAVLIVEDDRQVRSALRGLLTLEGCRVRTAKNGLEGLDRLRVDPPDVIILDLIMPVMGGEDFLLARADDPAVADIPVIVVSGHGAPAGRIRNLGAVAVLSKPVDGDRLLETVRAHVPRHTEPGPPI